MNPQSDRDLQQRLEQLEREANSASTEVTRPQPATPQIVQQTKIAASESLPLGQFFNWFRNLSSISKLIVISVGAVFGIAILRAVLNLVAAVISLGVLALVLYVGYRFFVSRAETKNR
ncbi:MAG: hypothetical protein N4J56_003884 [Chroococcidiopsis sp. SAG 2025]|uniref:hypothetical protein n=1 Tax=Chroococcidiopsis sp. SAG 2025 TaxID=171389 RepID=UPI002937019E|nr:hypothetical protein [Chroococcidiopsis sp. SAG 2025]MDV2994230.1 hypothetical protein [Chroococcidiopsis sp. SAG 2025]